MLRTIDEIEHISEDYQVKFYDYEKTFYGSTSNPDESDDNVIICGGDVVEATGHARRGQDQACGARLVLLQTSPMLL